MCSCVNIPLIHEFWKVPCFMNHLACFILMLYKRFKNKDVEMLPPTVCLEAYSLYVTTFPLQLHFFCLKDSFLSQILLLLK